MVRVCDVEDVLGVVAVFEAEYLRWHLLVWFAPSLPTPGTRNPISTSPLGGPVVRSAEKTHNQHHSVYTVILGCNPITRP